MNIVRVLLFNLVIFSLISISISKSDCQNNLKHETYNQTLLMPDSKSNNTKTFELSDLNRNSFNIIHNNINLNNIQIVCTNPTAKTNIDNPQCSNLILNKKPPAPTHNFTNLNNSQTVYITPTGKKYHKHKCGLGNYSLAISLKEAINKGYKQCKRCFKN